MGFTIHEAIIVTADEHTAPKAVQKAESLGLRCTSIVASEFNHHDTFLVVPDGSKEGWPMADTAADARRSFCLWLDSQAYEDGSSPFDYVEVRYTQDEDQHFAEVVRTNCRKPSA